MSRIGNAIIQIPTAVTLQVSETLVTVKGPKGELKVQVPQGVKINQENGTISVVLTSNDRGMTAYHGVTRAHLQNAITGVTDGWSKKLELVGVGYRAALSGVNLLLNVGYSHQVTIAPPAGITFQIVEGKVVVMGIDKHMVGEVSAKIREVRKPEPYKGKGIRYLGERVRKKAGKAAKAIGGAPGS